MNYYSVLLQFIKDNVNWIELLAEAPYFITVKQCPFKDDSENLLYPELYMFSYSQFESDFTNPIVKACRGSIVSIENNMPYMVCTPFYKFGNYGEDYTDEIDWESAVVRDKIDGCLIKLFNYKNQWYWITNNGWDITANLPSALKCCYIEEATEDAKTFEDLIQYTLKTNHPSFLKESLDPDYTYMFELISPQNRIICEYEKTELYLLGGRNKKTYQEVTPEQLKENFKSLKSFNIPVVFNLNNIDDVIKLCNSYSDTKYEGVVVCDKDFRRFKIKCAHYLEIKGFKHSFEGFNDTKIFEAWKNGTVDDIIGVFPAIQTQLTKIKEVYTEAKKRIDMLFQLANIKYTELLLEKRTKKDYALWVQKNFKDLSSLMFFAIKDNVKIEDFISRLKYEQIEYYANLYKE